MKKTFPSLQLYAAALCSLALMLSPSLRAVARPVVPLAKTAPAHRQKFDTTRFVPESELQRGQKGYALTVFHGTKIERFGVEILGVLSKVNNGKDLILIKVTSGPSVTRQANIAAGMSGSPVYIGQRMVGAIAYSLPFAREPIGLVTPIGDMLDSWDPDLPAKPSLALAATAADALSIPINSKITVSGSELAPFLGQLAGAAHASVNSTTTFEPIMTPVMVSGMSQAGIARLSPLLSNYNLVPMAGGGPPSSLTPADKATQLIPGAAVGVSLVQGDIDLTAIGTLTYRDGNRVIAFGHPFTGIGPIDAALTTASITDIFPSYQDSTKLGSPIQTVGRIFQDRPFSVGGIIGSMPHMVPVSVTIHDESDNRTKYFHARVIDHPLLTGPLVSQVVDEAILETHGTPGDAIAHVTTDVNAEQVGHIVRQNIFYDPLSIDQSAMDDLNNIMRLLSSNPFYPLAVRSVSMTVTIESKHPTAQIDHIFIPKSKYAPGDTLNVGVVLKPYRRDLFLVNIPLTIPTTAPDGSITIQVKGGASLGGSTISLGAGMIIIKPPTPTGPPAANIAQLVHQLLEQPKNNDLVASLLLPSTALDVQGQKLSLLPPNMSAVMRAEHSSGLKMERDEVKKTTPMNWIISGQQSLTITVAHKDITDQSSDTHIGAGTPPTADTGVTGPASSSTDDTDNSDSDTDSSDDSSGDDDNSTTDMDIPARLAPNPASASMDAPDQEAVASQEMEASTLALPQMPTLAAPPASLGTASGSANGQTGAKPTPVGRLASIWRQDSAAAFSEGTLNDVTVSSDNDLRIATSLTQVATSTAPYIWALVPDQQGNLFAGTGDDGIIYKVTGSKMAPYFHTSELEVSALAFDPATGDLYAGTAPHGAIFRITPDGKGRKIYSTSEKYVTALALDPGTARLYAATGGGSGEVYAIPIATPSAGKVLFSSPEAHLQSLAVGPGGQVYAGGAPDGLIYTITPDGVGKILYDASEPNISSLAVDSTGTVYASTSPHGFIYRITPGVQPAAPLVKKLIPAQDAAIYGLSVDADDNVWACSGNTVLRVAGDTVLSYDAPSDVSFVSLTLTSSGQVYAGTSNIGTVYALGSPSTGSPGTYTSAVHDAKLPARWGTIDWQASTPPGTSIQLQTRSGDVDRPDSTWSAWSARYTVAAGQQIASPPSRFIQYRATITGNAQAKSADLPRLQSVAIYYLTRNQAPTVKIQAPAGGDALSNVATLRWAGSDPDKDTLTYDVFYSSDNGKTWLPIKREAQTSAPAPPGKPTGLPTAKAGGSAVVTDADVAKALAEFKANIDRQPGIPPSVKEQMLAQAPQVIRQSMMMQNAGLTSSDSTADGADANLVTATSRKWDTRGVKDGTYQIKVIASDAPSNPTGSLTAQAVSAPFIVDNTPPSLLIDSARTTIDLQSHTAQLHGVATTSTCFVEAVQYHIDGSSDWSAAAADNGLFDSTLEPFTITTPALTPGPHTITVQVIDQAGNSTLATTQVTAP